MLHSADFAADGYPEVLRRYSSDQTMTPHGVVCHQWLIFQFYGHVETFSTVKGHLPARFPFEDSIQVLLESRIIILIFNLSVEQTVIYKQFHFGVLSIRGLVVDPDKK